MKIYNDLSPSNKLNYLAKQESLINVFELQTGLHQDQDSRLAEVLNEYISLLYELELIIDFPWMKWEKGRKIIQSNSGFELLGMEDCFKLITTILRADRFIEGTLNENTGNGNFYKIIKRLAILENEI